MSGFVANLRSIQKQYESWAADRRFDDLNAVMCEEQTQMSMCHPTRICDFLVWTVGAKLENGRRR